MNSEEYRRTMGIDMIREQQRLDTLRPAQVQQPDQRKQDEQCQGVDGELLKGVVIGATFPHLLPSGTKYFASLDDFRAWCDTEGGSTN